MKPAVDRQTGPMDRESERFLSDTEEADCRTKVIERLLREGWRYGDESEHDGGRFDSKKQDEGMNYLRRNRMGKKVRIGIVSCRWLG